MARKRQWYARYGAEEYYEYDPDRGKLCGWLLQGLTQVEIPQMQGWVSPRLGVTFGLEGIDLVLIGPDGKRFQSYRDVGTERNTALEERDEIATERDRERERAERLVSELDQEQKRAKRLAAERDQLATEREQEQKRAERLAAKLRELGIEP